MRRVADSRPTGLSSNQLSTDDTSSVDIELLNTCQYMRGDTEKPTASRMTNETWF